MGKHERTKRMADQKWTFDKIIEANGPDFFNMTALALRMSDQRSAVSEIHGHVTRKMWNGLWPDLPEDKVPITHVTNGVHVPSWIAPTMDNLFAEYIGEDWLDRHDMPDIWDAILNIPDEKLWNVLENQDDPISLFQTKCLESCRQAA